ncbi:hypothetical protein V6N12_003155 [Hibiscus sabdariffa]|uniref:Uncharacterized protein n=1 Tax=Hibiscus sabdariffa TaxID=183260 RepID=A0ABR2EB30_9ROSI
MARERSASPSRLDVQRSAKKGRSENSNMDMSAYNPDALGNPILPSKGAMGLDNPTLKPLTVEKTSYANVVLEGNQSIPKTTPTQFVDTDATIPSIQFLDRVHDQVDNNMRNAIIVRLLGRSIGFEALESRINALWKPVPEHCSQPNSDGTVVNDVPKAHEVSEANLFGSWMVVESKCRRNGVNTIVASHGNSTRIGGQFAALQIEDPMEQMGVERPVVEQPVNPTVVSQQEQGSSMKIPPMKSLHRNEAYLASNPDKKNLSSKHNNVAAEVIPLSKDRGARVIHHIVLFLLVLIMLSPLWTGVMMVWMPQLLVVSVHISASMDVVSSPSESSMGVNDESLMLFSPHGSAQQVDDIQNLDLLDVPVQGVGSQVHLG